MTEIVALQFGDELVELECDGVKVGATEEAIDDGVPPGYVRLNIVEAYDPAGFHGIPTIDAGKTALVSDEHVAMIQWEG